MHRVVTAFSGTCRIMFFQEVEGFFLSLPLNSRPVPAGIGRHAQGHRHRATKRGMADGECRSKDRRSCCLPPSEANIFSASDGVLRLRQRAVVQSLACARWEKGLQQTYASCLSLAYMTRVFSVCPYTLPSLPSRAKTRG